MIKSLLMLGLFLVILSFMGCSQGEYAHHLTYHQKHAELEREFEKGMSTDVTYTWMHMTGNAYTNYAWEAAFKNEDPRAFEIYVKNGLRFHFTQMVDWMKDLPDQKQKAFAEVYLKYASNDDSPPADYKEVLAYYREILKK